MAGGEPGGLVGPVLKRFRQAAGLSQEELAERAGLSAAAVSAIERGTRRRPHPQTLRALASALGLSVDDRARLISVAADPPPDRTGPAGTTIPADLPGDVGDFTGRHQEIAQALEHLTSPPGNAQAAPVLAISGKPGVGKSALAVHVAHALRIRFPDGQLYVDLQGATSGLQPLAPRDALRRLLTSLGRDPAMIPGPADEAAALFRSLAAERRLLVLLDNARGVEQVRPLLPGSPTCGVLVTSRQVLGTLEGACGLPLDLLPPQHALELLGRIAGPERVAADLPAAIEVTRSCDHLPLAIRLAGARLAARPTWPIGELARQLADATLRLETLREGDMAVQASFDISLQALQESSDPIDQRAAAAFGLLSLPDGPDLGVAAAARLIGQPEAAARPLLERLVDAQLLETPRPGRYRFHDLVRLYARVHGASRHPEAERMAALARAISFYTTTAWQTLALLHPHTALHPVADPRWTSGGVELADAPSARIWLESERANLFAAVAQAAPAADSSDAANAAALAGLRHALDEFVMQQAAEIVATIQDIELDRPDSLTAALNAALLTFARFDPGLLLYVRRRLLEGGPAGQAMFDGMLTLTRQVMDRLIELRLVRDDMDPLWGSLQFLVLNLGPLLLQPLIDRHLDRSLLSDAGLRRWQDANADLGIRGMLATPDNV
jgi:transcriptional regulator with XRE-family HTH domain